jgi:hypothetical protein
MEAKLEAVFAGMRERSVVGLTLAAEELKGRAANLAPLDEGELSKSGRVEVDAETGTAGVGFGTGPSAAYAIVQHEDMTYRHLKGRQSHYLSEPLESFGPDLIKIVGAEVEHRS